MPLHQPWAVCNNPLNKRSYSGFPLFIVESLETMQLTDWEMREEGWPKRPPRSAFLRPIIKAKQNKSQHPLNRREREEQVTIMRVRTGHSRLKHHIFTKFHIWEFLAIMLVAYFLQDCLNHQKKKSRNITCWHIVEGKDSWSLQHAADFIRTSGVTKFKISCPSFEQTWNFDNDLVNFKFMVRKVNMFSSSALYRWQALT